MMTRYSDKNVTFLINSINHVENQVEEDPELDFIINLAKQHVILNQNQTNLRLWWFDDVEID